MDIFKYLVTSGTQVYATFASSPATALAHAEAEGMDISSASATLDVRTLDKHVPHFEDKRHVTFQFSEGAMLAMGWDDPWRLRSIEAQAKTYAWFDYALQSAVDTSQRIRCGKRGTSYKVQHCPRWLAECFAYEFREQAELFESDRDPESNVDARRLRIALAHVEAALAKLDDPQEATA